MATFRPVAVITGASSGIGAELARVFAARGHEVVLTSRQEDKLNQVADGIGAAGFARPPVIPVDLARLDGGARLGHELAARGLDPAYVVNNAGFGLVGPTDGLDRAEQLAMIDLNVRTLTDLSLRWIDRIELHRGGILNVASVAGFLPGPGMSVYYASKAFVLSFTEALHHELADRGIRVTALCPGPVPTGFQARAGIRPMRAASLLEVSAEKVARAGYAGLMAGKRLVVPGWGNKAVTLLPRLLPRGLILRLTDARKRQRAAGARWPRER
ncbi:MAG: SDR family oxidoreductase [Variibacter sp.]|nr:SDR family oxidoreductase [Variibacter sp.]